MTTKICKKCLKELPIESFHKRKGTKDGRYSGCKKCDNIYTLKYRRKYQKTDKSKEYHKKYKQLDSYKLYIESYHNSKEFKEYQKKYQKEYQKTSQRKKYLSSREYKDSRNNNAHNRLLNDVIFKMSINLRSRLRTAFKQNYKKTSAVRDLGCTLAELKTHLEKQFQDGMNWGNWTRIDLHEKAWNIDHIIPLDNFDLTDEIQFKQAVHYTNLQPLWAIDNLKKGDKIYEGSV